VSFWAKVSIGVFFFATQISLLLSATLSRKAARKAIMNDKIGVEPCLLLRTAEREQGHTKWYAESPAAQKRAEARMSGLGVTQSEYSSMG